MADRQNIAAFKVVLDGSDLGEPVQDITGALGPRLISLAVSEKRGGEADQLDIVIHDHDGKMALPAEGARLTVAIGWASGAGVTPGMVDKGSFSVDEVEYSGSPDIITIRARSADFASGFRVRRERSDRDTTLGTVIRRVAADNGLTARIAPDLAGIAIPVLAQDQRSDMALVRDLGRRYDAVATVKARCLIFARIGSATTSTGLTIAPATIARSEGESFTYRRVEREQADAVEARYHDQDEAKRDTVKVDAKASGPNADTSTDKSAPSRGRRGDRAVRRLPKVYGSKDSAKAAAEGESSRIKRAGHAFEYQLGLGRPDLFPDRRIRVTGFKPEIDAKTWLIAEATHTLDAGGLTTSLKLETA